MYNDWIFRGNTDIFNGLKNFREFSSLDLCKTITELLDKTTSFQIFFHVGRNDIDLEGCLAELLLIILAGKNQNHKIILVSFIPQSYLNGFNSFFNDFDFLHLPDKVVTPSANLDKYNTHLLACYYDDKIRSRRDHLIKNIIHQHNCNIDFESRMQKNLKNFKS